MRTLTIALAVALVAPALLAQNPRPSQRVDNSGITFDPAVASKGNLSVVAYAGDNSIFVTTSDGRGLTWSTPVKVDSDATAARKDLNNGYEDIHIEGSTISMCWRDTRAGTDVFYARSTTAGATWSADVNVTAGLGTMPSASNGVSHRLAVVGDDVYILASVAVAGSPHELYLFTSSDGGATWSSPIYVPRGTASGDGNDIDSLDLAVDGQNVYVVWVDNRNANGKDEVFFQKSTDGGVTWLANDTQIDDPLDNSDADSFIFVEVRGNVVAVVWQHEPTGVGNETLHANVSTDGGVTFGGEQLIGGYTPGTDDVDSPWAAISASGNLVIAWEDNRTGGDEIYVAVSTDNGASWNADIKVTTAGGGFPRVVAATNEPTPPGCAPNVTGDCDIITWTSASFPNSVEGSVSVDGGATWSAPIALSSTVGDADFSEAAFNAVYQNFIVGWVSDDLGSNNMYVGGVRPQTVDPVGWVAGRTNVGFNLSGFGSDPAVLVLVAQTPGAFTIPGTCKMLDVGLDPFLFGTLGAFGAVLSGGAGSTPTYRVRLPAGQTFHFAAISIGAAFNQFTDAGRADT